MATYDDFLSRTLSEVPGCPEIAAIQALRDSAVEFCEKSLIHQVDHDPVSSIAKIFDYDLESPVTGTRVTKIMRAWFQGEPLEPAAPDQVLDPTAYNQFISGVSTAYSTPKLYFQKDHATFSLFPVPDKSIPNAVTLRVALAPLRDANIVADFLYEQWVEVISAGAIYRLQSSMGKAYHNPKLAQVFGDEYRRGINDARHKAVRGYTRANLRVQMRRP